MTIQNNNPFVLPGLGQSGELGQNPLLASMEMMQQAWQGMTGSGSLAQSSLATPMSLEDLERRIADLRTVENWLRMNLTMLSSSIQGLEVQRATIATIKSFIGAPASDTGASPLEVALGIKPSGQAKIRPAAHEAATPASNDGAEAPTPDALATTAGWWNMLQKQFDTLATATAATMQGAETMQAAAAEAVVPKKPSSSARPGKTAVKSSASKAPAKTAAKAAPRKRPASAPKKTRP